MYTDTKLPINVLIVTTVSLLLFRLDWTDDKHRRKKHKEGKF